LKGSNLINDLTPENRDDKYEFFKTIKVKDKNNKI